MSYDHNKQQLDNQQALLDPKPGDYWQEMFCPYFIVVQVKGPEITVLSCLGGPNSFTRKHEPCAKIDVDGSHWAFDYGKEMTVDRAWIERAVRYESIDGFVADVSNTEKTQRIVQEWRNFKQQDLRRQIQELEARWEEFTGWKYLKENTELTS
jgi:hypothetical protein